MPYKIYDDDGPMLRVIVNDWEVFGITLQYIQEDMREFYAQQITEALEREASKNFNKGRCNAQTEIRRSLGLE